MPVDLWPKSTVAYVSFISDTHGLAIEFPEHPDLLSLNPQLLIVSGHLNQASIFTPMVGFMGSGTTLLVSLLCTLYLWFVKPSGVHRTLIVFGALLFYDILCYTVFPVVFGMPHLIFIGGHHPEPVVFLAEMGVPFNGAVILIISICVTQITALCYLSRREGLFHTKNP